MNNSFFVKGSFVFVLLVISFTSYTNLTGPTPGNTNAPGETNCTSCHIGIPITEGNNWDNIELNLPQEGYVPGNTYDLTLSYAETGVVRKGFQLTALNNVNTLAGTLIRSGTGTLATTSQGRTYINHNSIGTSQSSWNLRWVAPSSGTGMVTFYVAINASNNDNTTNGDQIYLKKFAVYQQPHPQAPIAEITSSALSICLGDTLYLEGNGQNNPTGFEWEFTDDDIPGNGLQHTEVVFATAGKKTIKLTASNEYGQSLPATIDVQVKPLPAVGFIWHAVGLSVEFEDITANVKYNEWRYGDSVSELNIKKPTHTYADAGMYNVQLIVTDSFDCTNSQTQQIATAPPLGMKELWSKSLNIYPNPTSGQVFIEHGTLDNNAKLFVFDMKGRLVDEMLVENDKEVTVIETRKWKPGIYLCRLYDRSRVLTQKFIKE